MVTGTRPLCCTEVKAQATGLSFIWLLCIGPKMWPMPICSELCEMEMRLRESHCPFSVSSYSLRWRKVIEGLTSASPQVNVYRSKECSKPISMACVSSYCTFVTHPAQEMKGMHWNFYSFHILFYMTFFFFFLLVVQDFNKSLTKVTCKLQRPEMAPTPTHTLI